MPSSDLNPTRASPAATRNSATAGPFRTPSLRCGDPDRPAGGGVIPSPFLIPKAKERARGAHTHIAPRRLRPRGQPAPGAARTRDTRAHVSRGQVRLGWDGVGNTVGTEPGARAGHHNPTWRRGRGGL